jgi:hypothetical protein
MYSLIIDFHTNKPVGFFYNKDEAEKFRTGHQEEMTKGVAMFNYHQNNTLTVKNEKDIELHDKKCTNILILKITTNQLLKK